MRETSSRVAGRSRDLQIAAAMIVAATIGAMIVFGAGGFALVAPAVLGLVVLVVLVRCLHGPEGLAVEQWILRWTLAGFVIRIVVGLALTFAGGVFRAPDTVGYERTATQLLGHWVSEVPAPVVPPGKEGFYYLLAALFWIFGTHLAAAVAVNATLAAAIVPLMADSTRRLFGESAARYVPPLVVLMPGFLLWPSQPTKEAAIVFLIAVAINCAVRLSERISVSALVGLGMALSLLFTFRAWVALTITAGLVAGIALGRTHLLAGVGAGLGAASVLALIFWLGPGYPGYQAAVTSDLEEADTVRRDLAVTGSTGYDVDADISTPQTALAYLPRGLPNFFLGPFPWQIRSTRHLPAVPDVVVWWALIPSLWTGQRVARRVAGRPVLILVLPAAATSVLLALAVGNLGTVVRERVQVVLLLVPLIALGLSERAARRAPAPSGAPVPITAARS